MNDLISKNEKNGIHVLRVVGLAGLIGALFTSGRVWPVFLHNSYYFLTIALGCALFVAINHVSNAGWPSVLRRVPEAMMSYVPIGGIFLFLIFFGQDVLYEWTNTTYSHHGHELTFKNSYLSTGFFYSRMFFYVAVWSLLIYLIRRESLKQDENGNLSHTDKSKIYSAIFLVVFGITFTFASFDWIMSVEPMFFSTIYGFYHIAGTLLSGTAAITVFVIVLRRRGFLEHVGDRQLHALGKLVFGFATFWAYIWVCQYLLIYYANIPEETSHYVRRTATEDWSNLFYLNLFLNWIIPFLMLIQRNAKSNEKLMLAACGIVLIGHWVDLYVLIFPAFYKSAMISWIDLIVPFAFIGLFLMVFVRNFESKNLVPSQDPYLAEGSWQEKITA